MTKRGKHELNRNIHVTDHPLSDGASRAITVPRGAADGSGLETGDSGGHGGSGVSGGHGGSGDLGDLSGSTVALAGLAMGICPPKKKVWGALRRSGHLRVLWRPARALEGALEQRHLREQALGGRCQGVGSGRALSRSGLWRALSRCGLEAGVQTHQEWKRWQTKLQPPPIHIHIQWQVKLLYREKMLHTAKKLFLHFWGVLFPVQISNNS